MSGEPQADFDESIFDAPAPAAAAPAETKPEPQAEGDPPETKAAEPKTKIEETASKIGWTGKDTWRGDPDDWIDAPEFILKAAGEVLPSMRKSLEKANDEIAGLKKAVKTSIQHMTKARQEGYEQRSRELQAELAEFAKAGDVENVRSVTADIVALEKEVREDEPEPDEGPPQNPDFVAWREENPWFGKDKALTAACAAIGAEVLEEGYTGKAQIKEVDRRIREAFPEKFAKPINPNRNGAAPVEGAGAPVRRGGKSFSDMPKEHQDMCLDLMKQSKAITKENYAREFFSGEQR